MLLPKEGFIGKTISEIMPKEISKIANEKIQLVLTSGKMETFEYELEILGKKQYFELRIVKNNENLLVHKFFPVERVCKIQVLPNEYYIFYSHPKNYSNLFQGPF